jgi:hypothetical protein
MIQSDFPPVSRGGLVFTPRWWDDLSDSPPVSPWRPDVSFNTPIYDPLRFSPVFPWWPVWFYFLLLLSQCVKSGKGCYYEAWDLGMGGMEVGRRSTWGVICVKHRDLYSGPGSYILSSVLFMLLCTVVIGCCETGFLSSGFLWTLDSCGLIFLVSCR